MSAPVKTTEVRRMRDLRAQGLTNREIESATGRNVNTIVRHLGQQAREKTRLAEIAFRRRHAERVERLFRTCNRAIAEVRA